MGNSQISEQEYCPGGQMVTALDFGSKDCGFDFRPGFFILIIFLNNRANAV